MTETKMEVIKLMPKEYTQAEANAFKHGFFLGAADVNQQIVPSGCSVAVGGEMGGYRGDHAVMLAVSRVNPHIGRGQDLAVDAADGLDPQKTLVGDAGDDHAHLIEVSIQHQLSGYARFF